MYIKVEMPNFTGRESDYVNRACVVRKDDICFLTKKCDACKKEIQAIIEGNIMFAKLFLDTQTK